MQLRASLLLATMASVAAAKKPVPQRMDMSDISATSKLGGKLMSSARRLNDNNERDQTWVANYSLRFKSCHTITTVPSEEGGGGEEGMSLYNSNIVVFQLCKTSTCGAQKDTCQGGAEYAVNMAEFVEAYVEAKQEKEEAICGAIEENCYCDNADDDQGCANRCYVDQGADYCVEYDDGQEEVEIQDLLMCEAMENYEAYYVGPYCAEGGDGIYIGVFGDAGCVNHAEDGLDLYAKVMYRALPYSSESIVGDECVSCLQVDEDNGNDDNNNNNNNNGDEAEIVEMCERMYEEAAKCETNLDYSGYSNYWYADETACNYINYILPRLDKAFGVKSRSASGDGGPAKGFAIFFGISTFALAGVCYWLYTKVQRTSVDLSAQGGTTV